jgi:hypothetical protein
VNLLVELMRTLGWEIRLRKAGIVNRLQHLLTIAVYLGGIGTAIGYAIASRGFPDDDGASDAGETG